MTLACSVRMTCIRYAAQCKLITATNQLLALGQTVLVNVVLDSGRLGKKFSCLTANPTVAVCEIDVQYNLYNASLFDFSNVVYDRPSAGTENDGSTLFSEVTVTVDPLDMKIQAVYGNVVSLASEPVR